MKRKIPIIDWKKRVDRWDRTEIIPIKIAVSDPIIVAIAQMFFLGSFGSGFKTYIVLPPVSILFLLHFKHSP
jgi:hypothetical protein